MFEAHNCLNQRSAGLGRSSRGAAWCPLGKAITAITEGWIVVTLANARVEAHTVDNTSGV